MNDQQMREEYKKVQDRMRELETIMEAESLEMPDMTLGREELFAKIVENKELFSIMLCYVALMTSGRYINILYDVAKNSMEAKKNRKLYLVNVILDILKYLKFIEYVDISEKEERIIVKITNEELANELNSSRFALEKNPEMFQELIEAAKKDVQNNPEAMNKLKEKGYNFENDTKPFK